jgi:hypothetical protein
MSVLLEFPRLYNGLKAYSKNTHPELNEMYSKYLAPYMLPSIITALLSYILSLIFYSNTYNYSLPSLWSRNYFTIIFFGIAYVIAFVAIIISFIFSEEYLRQTHKNLKKLSLKDLARELAAISGPLICVIGIGYLFCGYTTSVLWSIPFYGILIFLLTATNEKIGPKFISSMIVFSFFAYVWYCYLTFIEIGTPPVCTLISVCIASVWTYIIIFTQIKEEFDKEHIHRAYKTLSICFILGASSFRVFNALLYFTYTGGGLPIQIIQEGNPVNASALLVMDREENFIAFDKEAQSSKIYNKAKVSWKLAKPVLNSENNNVTMSSTQEG